MSGTSARQRRRLPVAKLIGALSLLAVSGPASAQPFDISFPLQCALNETCFVQNYVDADPGPGARDYRCGISTYDGHKGTDFRILSTLAAKDLVPVIAAAAGRVRAIRDGVTDRLIEPGASFAQGGQCGNGVVIDHGQGRTTQYCHLRKGSVRVRPGQRVERGEILGAVGYSGEAQFAHLELTVRINGQVVDPFTGQAAQNGCGGQTRTGLWQTDGGETFEYNRGQLVELGFADRPVSPRDLETGLPASARPSAASKAFVFYARFINLEKGDRLRLVLDGPSGSLAKTITRRLDRRKAQYVAYLGKKLRADRWEDGRYRGLVQLLRDGAVVAEKDMILDLR